MVATPISLAEIVACANENAAVLDGSMAPIHGILDASDLVFCVWQDATEPDGVGMMIVKGKRRLEAIGAASNPLPIGVSERSQVGAWSKQKRFG